MEKQGILVTGASGFVGRHFIEASKERFRLFCLARRSQLESGIPKHENIFWTQVDIGSFANIRELAESIGKLGGADYVLHLAGYYDFSYKDHPEYYRTNVLGTENILKLAKELKIKRFIFSSSLAACEFGDFDHVITEETPPAADFAYARSKCLAENRIKEFSGGFSYAIVRLAAVFSDWCEYPPLFIFLSTWLSKKWKSRILGGKGESAITYIHINDLIRFFDLLLEKDSTLPGGLTLIASPDGTVSHNDLYKAATKYYFGKDRTPIRIPKLIAYPGVLVLNFLSNLFGFESFEKPWMIKYVDKKLVVDSTRSQKLLAWETAKRYDIPRRLLFLLENRKNHFVTWSIRNEMALRRTVERPSILYYELMKKYRSATVEKVIEHLILPENGERFSHYQAMGRKLLKMYITLIYQLIAISIRTVDRMVLRKYAQIIAYRRFNSGFKIEEIAGLLNTLETTIITTVNAELIASDSKRKFNNYVSIAIQLVIDEIDESFACLAKATPRAPAVGEKFPSLESTNEIKQILSQLEDTFYDSLEHLDGDLPFGPVV